MRERQETPKWWLNGSDQAFAAHHFKLALNPDETRDSSSYYDGYTVLFALPWDVRILSKHSF